MPLTDIYGMRAYIKVDMVVILHTIVLLKDRSMPTNFYVVQSKTRPAGARFVLVFEIRLSEL